MNTKKTIAHWIEISDRDFKTMNLLFSNKEYAWSLFIGHLVIEKLLKACYVKKHNEHPPFIHNLQRLAEKTSLQFSEDQLKALARITTFNLNTRYDDYKKTFYKTCSKAFTNEWISNIKSLRTWIKNRL